MPDYSNSYTYSTASGMNLPYVVIQVTLKEKFFGTGSGNLTELESAINDQVSKGYRLHTISTANGGSKGFAGGDRIQATLVFERLDLASTPVRQAPYQQVPGQQAPVRQVPGQQAPGRQVPGQQMPGQQVSGQQVSGQQVSGQQVPGRQVPGRQQ